MVFFKQSELPTAKPLTLPTPPSLQAIVADLNGASGADPVFAIFRKESALVPSSIAGLLREFDGAMRSDAEHLLSHLAVVATQLDDKLAQLDVN
jgi:hypothetical protein